MKSRVEAEKKQNAYFKSRTEASKRKGWHFGVAMIFAIALGIIAIIIIMLVIIRKCKLSNDPEIKKMKYDY